MDNLSSDIEQLEKEISLLRVDLASVKYTISAKLLRDAVSLRENIIKDLKRKIMLKQGDKL